MANMCGKTTLGDTAASVRLQAFCPLCLVRSLLSLSCSSRSTGTWSSSIPLVNIVGTTTCSLFAWSLGLVLAAMPLLPWTEHWDVFSSNAVCCMSGVTSAGREASELTVLDLNVHRLQRLLCVGVTLGQLGIYRAVFTSIPTITSTTDFSTYNSVSPG